MKKIVILTCLTWLLSASQAFPCTIISGKTNDDEVWIGNNEDSNFDFGMWMHVLPPEGRLLGAINFTHGAPENFIEGGFNEKGLFFDFNSVPSVPTSEYEGWETKKDFPGGENAFALHILRNCSSVLEVLSLLKGYRLPVLLGVQMHLADSQGHLALVNADSMRLTQGPNQVSTNFNVSTRSESAEGKACWRFPIADRMLKEHGASLDNFRTILDATQQPRYVSTIYSNIVNLATGDVYLYYAGDFQHAVHFTLDDVLAKGKKSYLICSLFPEAPIVKVWNAYQAQGAEKSLGVFRQLQGSLPEKRSSEILRHLFLNCLIYTSQYTDAHIFFDEWLKVNKGEDKVANFYGAFIHLSNGNYEKAKDLLAEQVKIDATDELAKRAYPGRIAKVLARLQGVKSPQANVRFELKGYQAAKFVGLYLPGKPAVYNFLLRTSDGWAGDFPLPPGTTHYAFAIDGKMSLDPLNPLSAICINEDGKRRLNVKLVQ